MTIVVSMKFGSTIYGTRTPSSDTDLKSVFIPSARDIVLGTTQDVVNLKTKLNERAKNTSEDVDDERFSLKRYLQLLAEGNTPALDMFFCPEEHIIEASPVWRELQANKDKLIHSGASAFVGYCRTQANKYGIKGSRVAAVRSMVELLKDVEPDWKLEKLHTIGRLDKLIETHPNHASFVMCKGPSGSEALHIEVCNRKTAMNVTVKYALERYQAILDQYGQRALAAENNQGIDWKALSHAVRVCREAVELLETGRITFPRPEATLLLEIKRGKLQYKEVADLVEEGMLAVEAAAKLSTLPKTANHSWINDFVYSVYSKEIV